MKKFASAGGDMPIDVLIEIFSRLPSKSVARCRCVSKTWDSMLRLPSFTELFLTRSLARPQLLFACHNKINNEVFFFSATQPRIADENLSLVTASYQMKIPYNFKFERFSPTRGLVFLRDERILEGCKVSVICNPSTGQYWNLPRVKTRMSNKVAMISFFGYDPVEKQYKILSTTSKNIFYGQEIVYEEYQVMTLGTGVPSWRKIECSLSCSPSYKHSQICINGVLYYTAFGCLRYLEIVSFDVKSEKFSFIKYMERVVVDLGVPALINCNGKLGSLMCEASDFVNGISSSITLWVLEDAEKQEWLKHVYVLPSWWQNIVGEAFLRFIGVTQTKEIVLSIFSPSAAYYIFYYNTERETITRVEISGMEAFKAYDVYTYLDHVEDVKLMQMF